MNFVKAVKERAAESVLEIGKSVKIHDLKSATQLNGLPGTLRKFSDETGRWQVELDNGEVKALKPENLVRFVRAAEKEQDAMADMRKIFAGVKRSAPPNAEAPAAAKAASIPKMASPSVPSVAKVDPTAHVPPVPKKVEPAPLPEPKGFQYNRTWNGSDLPKAQLNYICMKKAKRNLAKDEILYKVKTVDEGFQATVRLPPDAGDISDRKYQGDVCRLKTDAEHSAAHVAMQDIQKDIRAGTIRSGASPKRCAKRRDPFAQ